MVSSSSLILASKSFQLNLHCIFRNFHTLSTDVKKECWMVDTHRIEFPAIRAKMRQFMKTRTAIKPSWSTWDSLFSHWTNHKKQFFFSCVNVTNLYKYYYLVRYVIVNNEAISIHFITAYRYILYSLAKWTIYRCHWSKLTRFFCSIIIR